MKISVLIPVYNERLFVREIVRRVYEQSELLHEVVVVDDGSTDGSRERIAELEKRYGRHPVPLRAFYKDKNEGKGSAIQEGLSHVEGDAVLIQDADLEYDPRDYNALLAPLRNGQADVVYGSRFIGSQHRVLLFWHTVANKILTLLCNLLSDLNLTDVWTGYKLFRTDLLRAVSLRSRGFGFEPEVTIKMSKLGCRLFEVPISYNGRTYVEGKKIGAKDALTGILAMLRAWVSADTGSLTASSHSRRIVSRTPRYNAFLYEQIRPHLGSDVVVVGAGLGNISRMLLDRDSLVLTDGDPGCVQQLEQAYCSWEHVRVRRLDPVSPDQNSAELWGRFDSVVSSHVLGCVEDDRRALATKFRLLKSGGRLVLTVPAHQELHGAMDEALGYSRRYGEEDLKEKLSEAGFEVETIRFLNQVAVPGWWFNGKLLRRPVFLDFQLRCFDRMVFLVRWLAALDIRFGLVIFAVARKPA